MERSAQLARPAVESLLSSEEDQLFAELEIRRQAIADDPSLAGSFDPDVAYDARHMGALDDLTKFGRVFFDGINRDCYAIACGSNGESTEDRRKLADAFRLGPADAATFLAGLLVAHLAMAPAIAAVIAALVVKLFFKNALNATCAVWKDHLPPA